jgi:hypothetical protein
MHQGFPYYLTNFSFVTHPFLIKIKLLFLWPYNGILRKGMKNPLTETDIPDISKEESSNYNLLWYQKLCQKNQEIEQHGVKKSINLHRALVHDFFKSSW